MPSAWPSGPSEGAGRPARKACQQSVPAAGIRRRALCRQSEAAHAAGVLVGEPGEHPPELGEVGTGPVPGPHAADEERGEGVTLDRDLLGLGEGLPDQAAPPQGEPTGDALDRP